MAAAAELLRASRGTETATPHFWGKRKSLALQLATTDATFIQFKEAGFTSKDIVRLRMAGVPIPREKRTKAENSAVEQLISSPDPRKVAQGLELTNRTNVDSLTKEPDPKLSTVGKILKKHKIRGIPTRDYHLIADALTEMGIPSKPFKKKNGRTYYLVPSQFDKEMVTIVKKLVGTTPASNKPQIYQPQPTVIYRANEDQVKIKPILTQETSRETNGRSISPEIIAQAQTKDHEAFVAIFYKYQNPIYSYVYRMMGNPEDALDLTQDTFMKAYQALPRTSHDLRVGAWLYRIATNVCIDELRHRKLIKWHPWETFISIFHPSQVARDNPERDVLDKENQEEAQLILDRLHPKYRMCLILREYQDLSYDEIAEVLGTTRATVKSLLFRAREEFRQVYARVERRPEPVPR